MKSVGESLSAWYERIRGSHVDGCDTHRDDVRVRKVPGLARDVRQWTASLGLKSSADAERDLRSDLGGINREGPRRWSTYVSIAGDPWVDLLSPNGYVRETALKALDGPPPNLFLMSVFVRRLNDWVPAVQHAAVPAFARVAPHCEPKPLSELTMAVLTQSSAWRRNPDAVSTLRSCFALPSVRRAGLEELIGAKGRSGVLSALLVGDNFDDALSVLAERAVQPSVRGLAVSTLVRGTARWMVGRERVWVDKPSGVYNSKPVNEERSLGVEQATCDDVLRWAVDRSARVRRAVLDALIEVRQDHGRAVAAALADDPWPSIRERAAFLLR